MQYHSLVAVLTATIFVTGCGFVPKKPPMPKNNVRVPVNLAAPYPRPWPPPKPTRISEQIQPHQVATQSVQPIVVTEPVARIESDEVVDSTKTIAAHEDQAPIWPVTLTFREKDFLDPSAQQIEPQRVILEWHPYPAVESSPLVPKVTASAETDSSTPSKSAAVAYPVDQAPIDATQAIDMAATLSQESETLKINEPTALTAANTSTGADTPVPPRIVDKQILQDSVEGVAKVVDVVPVEETPAPPPMLTWTGHKGMTLFDMLSEWGSKEDWTVHWETKTRFRIEAPFSIEAPDFLAAANHVFKLYTRAGYKFIPLAHSNRVLVVTTP